MAHYYDDVEVEEHHTPPLIHPSADPHYVLDFHKPRLNFDESIPLLLDMETHVSTKIKQGEDVKFKGICSNLSNIKEWYASLNDDVKLKIRNAGFETFVISLMRPPCERGVVQAVAERWLDTTHTFIFNDFEATITSTDFSAITRIEMGGEPIPFDIGGYASTERVRDLLGFIPRSWHGSGSISIGGRELMMTA